jgi:four helix bundle protein
MSDGGIQSHRDLRAWQDAITLAENCYRLTKNFPRDELFGMTSQIRRSAASLPANIAEGYGRETSRSYVQSLRIAQGSLKELETHLVLSERVGLSPKSAISDLVSSCEQVGKMLRALIRAIQNTDKSD